MIAFVCLALGLINYILFRHPIRLFDFISFSYDIGWRVGFRHLSYGVYSVFSNHFSDLMWAIAVLQFSMVSRKQGVPFIYTFLLMTSPFLSELGQYFNFIDGTFDILDILVYSVVFIATFKNYLWRNLKSIYLALAY